MLLIATTIVIAAIIALVMSSSSDLETQNKPVKIGILHSLSGTMAISERSVVDAALLAVDEINAGGGVIGRQILPVVVDGQSDWITFQQEAERLITEEDVSVIFGCWTSACRKMVKPVIERRDHLLFYPIQYEGLEESPNIVYTGAAPNQQIIPAVKWFLDNRGKRFFLVGSDYVFPWAANAIIKDYLGYLGGETVGEEYILLGSKEVDDVISKIVAAKPDVIFNTINGDTNLAFFQGLASSGIDSYEIPTVSFSIAEEELRFLDSELMAGNYAVWNYFQSLDTPDNHRFVESFKRKYGEDRVVDDAIRAGYLGLYLWAAAVESAGTDDVSKVKESLRGQQFDAPGETVYVDSENLHTWKSPIIGQIKADGQFGIVWKSETIIHPVPYPVSRTRSQWNRFLISLYDKWGGSWANPG
jgi:urea transport system substrate-binding protein|tara:strand:+ start:2845 stop:4092 length:1248 start_codon:yes stop_codon:yes gene_type:complete